MATAHVRADTPVPPGRIRAALTDCTITKSLVQPSMRIHHLAQAHGLTE